MNVSTQVTVGQQPSPQPLATAERHRRVTGRTKRALDLMVWDALTDNEAAVQVGMTVTAIRLALKLPHVRAYYHAALQVLRARESSRNIHALVEVRDQKSNQMARVAAVKALEQLEDQPQAAAGAQSRPGLLIQIINPPAQAVTNGPYVADKAKPLIEHDVVSDADHTSE